MTETRIGAAGHAVAAKLMLAIAVILLVAAAITDRADAAFSVTGYSLTQSTSKAGAHPSLTIKSTLNASSLDQTGDDLSSATYDLHAGTKLNPRSVITPCTTSQHAADTCPASTKIGQVTQKWRLGGISNGSASGDIYALPASETGVMGLGFVLRSSSYNKLIFTGRVEGAADNQRVVVTSIPRYVKSGSIQYAITTSELQLVFNSRSGASQNGSFLVHGSTSCEAATSYAMLTAMTGEFKQHTASLTQSECSALQTGADVEVARSSTRSGDATGLKTTVYADTTDKTIQNSHVKEVLVDLPSGSSLNSTNLNAPELCAPLGVQLDVCPTNSKIGTATFALPFLTAPLIGDIDLISRGSVVEVGMHLRGPNSTRAVAYGSLQVMGGKVQVRFKGLPQVPLSIAEFNLTSKLVNNPTACSTATVWHDVTGWSGARSLIGEFIETTDCLLPPDTMIYTGPTNGSLIRSRTPAFGFVSNQAEGSTFECSIDAAAFAACTSMQPVAPLADGQHNFRVRAVNAAGPDATPATRTFTVDATPPAAEIAAPASNAVIKGTSVRLEYTAEAGSTTTCVFDGQMTTPCSSPKVYNDVAPGSYVIGISVKDAAGNVRFLSRSITVEAAGPTIQITSPAHGTTSIANWFPLGFTATNADGSPVTNVRCVLYFVYLPQYGYEYEERSIPNCTSGTTLSVDTDSHYRIEVIATAADGSQAVASSSFVGGPRLPNSLGFAENTPSGQIINDRTPTIELVYNDSMYPNATFECSLVTQGSQPVWEPCGNSSNLQPYQVTQPLVDGDYVLYTRAHANGLTSFRNGVEFSVKDWSVEYTTSTSTQQAGAHPDLNTSIEVTGGGQFRKIDMRLPKGLIGSLNSFPKCQPSEYALRACPEATRVGNAVAKIKINGISGALKDMPGPAFFTEPYVAGDVAGLFVLIPSPVGGFDDVEIKLRVQLIDNAQQMRVFSDELPIKVLQIFSGDWIDFWTSTFKLNINGSQGSPYPFLTNPTNCAAGEFSTVFGDADTSLTPAKSIPWQASGCEQLTFEPSIAQTFTSPIAGTSTGISAEISVPEGNSNLKRVVVREAPALMPNFPGFGSSSTDQCPPSAIIDRDPSPATRFVFTLLPTCPAAAKIGTMTVESPLLPTPMFGTVHLVSNGSLPRLGVKLDYPGISLTLAGQTTVNATSCDETVYDLGCPDQVQVTFDNIPDLPLSKATLLLNDPPRSNTAGTQQLSSHLLQLAQPFDTYVCREQSAGWTSFLGQGGATKTVDEIVDVAGCDAP